MKLAKDKQLHLAAGFLITLVFGLLFTPIIGFGLGVAAGIGKEVYDYFNKETNTPDMMDAVVTALGALICFIILSRFK